MCARHQKLQQNEHTPDIKLWKSKSPQSISKDRFICKYCAKAYGSRMGLWYHIKEHEGNFTHTCNYCGKGFNRKGQYEEHITAHEGRGYLCLKCHKVFRTDSLLKKHRVTCSQQDCVDDIVFVQIFEKLKRFFT